jgi:hypothetical protein
MILQQEIVAREMEGYAVLQRGKVKYTFEQATELLGCKPTCADRFSDFNAALVVSGDVLLDDVEEWVHMRRNASK